MLIPSTEDTPLRALGEWRGESVWQRWMTEFPSGGGCDAKEQSSPAAHPGGCCVSGRLFARGDSYPLGPPPGTWVELERR